MDWLDSASIGDPPVSVQTASLSTLAPTGASVSDSLLWRKVMQLVALNVKTEKIILLSYSELQKFNYPFWLIHIILLWKSVSQIWKEMKNEIKYRTGKYFNWWINWNVRYIFWNFVGYIERVCSLIKFSIQTSKFSLTTRIVVRVIYSCNKTTFSSYSLFCFQVQSPEKYSCESSFCLDLAGNVKGAVGFCCD